MGLTVGEHLFRDVMEEIGPRIELDGIPTRARRPLPSVDSPGVAPPLPRRLPLQRDHRVDQDDRADRGPLGDEWDHESSERGGDQHQVGAFGDGGGHDPDVLLESGLGIIRGQVDCHHLVARCRKERCDPVPVPSRAPGAGDQDVAGHREQLLFVPPQSLRRSRQQDWASRHRTGICTADDPERHPAVRDTIGRMKRAALRRIIGVMATVIAVGGPASGSFLASYSAGAAGTGGCGTVLLPGGEWLGGTGVNVYSNGTYEGTRKDCVNPGGAAYNYFNGTQTGQKWQGAELVNRLYLSKSLIMTTWRGSAGSTFFGDAPSNLVKESNGSVSHLGPGDVVDINVSHNGTADGGELLVVNDGAAVSSGTVTTVSQDAGTSGNATVQIKASISSGSVTTPGGNGLTYAVIGVIHAPPAAPPMLEPLASTSGSAGFATEFAVTCPRTDQDIGIDVVAPSELSGGDYTFSPGSYHFIEQTALSAPVGNYSFKVDCVTGIAGNRPQWRTTHAFPAVTMHVTGPSVAPTITPA